MNEPAPGAVPEPVTETWTYGGIRADKDGRKWHVWVDPAGEEHWFARTGGRMAVGSHYSAWVTRRDDGGITLHGTPEYAGSQASHETRAALWTEHTLAQTRIESLRAERDDARRNALDEAIARSWNWPPRCAPARSATPSPPTSSASSTAPGTPGNPRAAGNRGTLS